MIGRNVGDDKPWIKEVNDQDHQDRDAAKSVERADATGVVPRGAIRSVESDAAIRAIGPIIPTAGFEGDLAEAACFACQEELLFEAREKQLLQLIEMR